MLWCWRALVQPIPDARSRSYTLIPGGDIWLVGHALTRTTRRNLLSGRGEITELASRKN